MAVDNPDAMNTEEIKEPEAPQCLPILTQAETQGQETLPMFIPDNDFGKTAWDELSNVSETPLIDDQNLFTESVSPDSDIAASNGRQKCGHLTSHCCLPNGSLEQINSSRSSSDSGVNMGNIVGVDAYNKIPVEVAMVHSESDTCVEDKNDSKVDISYLLNTVSVQSICTDSDGNIHSNQIKDDSTTKTDKESGNFSHQDPETKLLDLKVPEDFRLDEINECTKLEFPDTLKTKLVGCPVMKNVIESRYQIDTVLSCFGGKIGGHRAVLAAASPFFAELLQDHRLGEVATLILPDISVKVVELLLNLCYTGEMIFPKILEREVYEAMECLMIGAFAQLSLKEVMVKIRPPEPQVQVSVPLESTIPVVLDPIPASSSSSHQKPTTIPESPNSPESSSRYQKIPAVGTLLPEQKYRCSRCPTIWSSKASMARHSMKVHKREFRSIDIPNDDFQTLCYCSVCDKQHTDPTTAAKCDKAHKLARCWNCLGIFPVSDILNHYRKAHGINTEDDGMTVKCRWCDLVVRAASTQTIRLHASTHIPSTALDGPPKHPQQSTGTPNKKGGTNPSVLPFLNRRVDDIDMKVSKSLIAFKKRKMDENGKPLQVARRTGVPVGRNKKLRTLSPSQRYNAGTFSLSTDDNGKVASASILQLPEVNVLLDFTTEEEIEKHLKNYNYEKDLSHGKEIEDGADNSTGKSTLSVTDGLDDERDMKDKSKMEPTNKNVYDIPPIPIETILEGTSKPSTKVFREDENVISSEIDAVDENDPNFQDQDQVVNMDVDDDGILPGNGFKSIAQRIIEKKEPQSDKDYVGPDVISENAVKTLNYKNQPIAINDADSCPTQILHDHLLEDKYQFPIPVICGKDLATANHHRFEDLTLNRSYKQISKT